MASRQHSVSVVIPTYNRAGMLREALESVLGQTWPPAEVVVVDDGSTDGTPQVVDGLAGQGAPVVYLRGPHTSDRSAARNRGAAATSGDIIAFLDSDDIWKPQRLERQLAAWDLAPEAGFAFCNARRFTDTGLVGGPCLPVRADYSGYILGDILEEPRAGGSTLLVKREAFEGVGGFAELPMNEDYELTLRLAARYQASYAPEVLVLVREHPGRVTLQHGAKPLVDYIAIVEGFMARNPLPTGVRARARAGLANVHLKLARLYLEGGNRQAARRHIVSVIRLRPWDRRWPSIYLRCLSPARAGR